MKTIVLWEIFIYLCTQYLETLFLGVVKYNLLRTYTTQITCKKQGQGCCAKSGQLFEVFIT